MSAFPASWNTSCSSPSRWLVARALGPEQPLDQIALALVARMKDFEDVHRSFLGSVRGIVLGMTRAGDTQTRTRDDASVATIDDVRRFLDDEHGLVVVSTARADGSVLSSVVNAGVLPHPATGDPAVAFVSAGSATRLRHLRRGAPLTLVARRGWRWVGVTGPADLIGPDDPVDRVDSEGLRRLLRDVFVAAGGSHDDWDEYDRVMAEERRVAVFVRPERVTGNA